jgi:hypothetical protein
MELEELVGAGLVGGTLVEYKASTGFGLEFGRGKITEVGMDGTMFFIHTDNKESFLEQNVASDIKAMGYGTEVEKKGPFFLLSSSMGWCYVAAPPGVEVPKKPGWLDVSDEEFADAMKRHYGVKE